jgi:hypothetical protein
VKDNNCNNKCLAHSKLWIDLYRQDECDCGEESKRLFSYHNYIIDIPLDKLISLANNVNAIEMGKTVKFKSGRLSNEIGSMLDLKGKLVLYFKMLLNQTKIDCPKNGVRCEVNKTNKKFNIANMPNYLVFNLGNHLNNNQKKNNTNSILEILQLFVLIPKIFDISTIFEHSSKQKMFFEFLGAICVKPSKTFTCFFKNNEKKSWNFFEDEKVTKFDSMFDLISHCLTDSQTPLMIFYQLQNKYNDSAESEISNDELFHLERYARNSDDLTNILNNKFRHSEDLIKFDNNNLNIADDHRMSNTNVNNNNNNNNNNQIKQNNLSKHSSTSISTSKNNSSSNSNSRLDLLDYMCPCCNTRNKIECNICFSCNKNNNLYIDELIKKKNIGGNGGVGEEKIGSPYNNYLQSNNNPNVLTTKKQPSSNNINNNPFYRDEEEMNSKSTL